MTDLTNKPQNAYITATNAYLQRGNPVLETPKTPADLKIPGVRQPQQPTAVDPASPPAKATSAPTGNSNYAFTGLAEALNTYQNQLVKDGIYQIADFYEFQFNPIALGSSKVKKAGSTDRSKTAGKNAATARQALDSTTDAVSSNSQNWNVQAGTQIIQVIDQIMRSSEYISQQATAQIDANTQKNIPSTSNGIIAWYNVSVQAVSLGFDNLRRDFAYHMTFVITPYSITKMVSDYFPDSRYRGSHKSYNYWFTGQNTEVLSFEQKYDASYNIIMNGSQATQINSAVAINYREQYSKTAMPTTNEKTGQQTGTYTNAAADSAADFLYSQTDYALAKIRIVGDPAWLQQGSVTTGVTAQQFTFDPFNADGSINYDSQMVNFDINWNQPADYDFATGVMDLNNTQGRPKVNNTYYASECRSFFSRGKFEQELEGKLLIESKPDQANSTAPVERVAPKTKPTSPPPLTGTTPLKPSQQQDQAAVGMAASIVRPNGTSFNPFLQARQPGGPFSGNRTPLAPNNPLNPNNYSN